MNTAIIPIGKAQELAIATPEIFEKVIHPLNLENDELREIILQYYNYYFRDKAPYVKDIIEDVSSYNEGIFYEAAFMFVPELDELEFDELKVINDISSIALDLYWDFNCSIVDEEEDISTTTVYKLLDGLGYAYYDYDYSKEDYILINNCQDSLFNGWEI